MSSPKLIFEPSDATPLVWFEVAIPGGASADPIGIEGLHRHAALLARRGAGERPRQLLDDTLDAMGAAVEVGVGRDSISLSGLCLTRHVDKVIDIAADILAAPRFDADEHLRLVRETPQVLDEIRDDDSALATRWFDWLVAPGHPYGRTSLGTEKSIARLTLEAAKATWRDAIASTTGAGGLTIGFAGDASEGDVARWSQQLVDRMTASITTPPPRRAAGSTPPATTAPRRSKRELVVVDKAERTQAQLRFGHPSMRYGEPDTAAMCVVEAVFGGMFTSRLMQEIRVKRGWSYGAGCGVRRARRPHWFEIWMATGIDVAADAIALTLQLFEDLAANGPTDDEVALARSYLVGSLPFSTATARQRLQLRVRDAIFDLPDGYSGALTKEIAQVDRASALAACQRQLRPAEVLTVAVTTASSVRDKLKGSPAGIARLVAHDDY